jgi:hypothetical protein
MKIRKFLLFGLAAIVLGLLAAWPVINKQSQVRAEPDIFASPIHGGCYVSGPSECRLHVEPYTINIASGKKLVRFQLVAIQMPNGTQTTIYDWRPDQSNPAPSSGTTYTPSLVSQDFAATCGKTYEISLQGMDTGDANLFNLGLTGQFTCPSNAP